MAKHSMESLSRRERQIMEIIYRKGVASASEVQESLPDPPSYSSVRTILRVLENKGYLRHKERDLKYVYLPVVSQQMAKQTALQHLLKTFFNGSPERVVAALLDNEDIEMSDEQLQLTLKESSESLFRLRLQAQTERLDAPSELRKQRRTIARVKTIQTERAAKAAAK